MSEPVKFEPKTPQPISLAPKAGAAVADFAADARAGKVLRTDGTVDLTTIRRLQAASALTTIVGGIRLLRRLESLKLDGWSDLAAMARADADFAWLGSL